MAKIGMRRLYWAKFAAETMIALPTYGTGMLLGAGIVANESITYATAQQPGDDKILLQISQFSSGSIAAETNYLTAQKEADLYGETMDGNELGSGGNDSPPYGGMGYIQVVMTPEKVTKYRAFFYPKVQAQRAGESTASKTPGSITIGNVTITFTIFEPSFGKWRYMEEFSTEAAAIAYLETKLNVATWYEMNIQVQGAGAGEGVSPVGVSMAAASASFELIITGTPTALYDNGVDNVGSIAAGKYTVASVAAAHTIAVIF